MRRPRKEVQKLFGINDPEKDAFAKMLEECILEQEMHASMEMEKRGKRFSGLNPERKMEVISEML